MDKLFREIMDHLGSQKVNGEESKNHAGLELRHWNMIQITVSINIGKELWLEKEGAVVFKDVLNEQRNLVSGFASKTKEEQDKIISEIEEKVRERMGE